MDAKLCSFSAIFKEPEKGGGGTISITKNIYYMY